MFGPEKFKLLDRKFFLVPLEKMEEMVTRNGFVVTYKKLSANHFVYPDVETFLQFLYGSSGGELDPEKANQESLETSKQKYCDRTAEVSSVIAYFKPSKL